MAAIVALTMAALLGVFVALAVQVNRPYPGFFFSLDYRVFPVSAESRAARLSYGDKILTVDGHSPLDLMRRVGTPGRPVHYEVQHAGRRVAVDLSPLPFGWRDLIDHFGLYFLVSIIMLAVGVLVFGQNPTGVPNRNFLIYMCLWAVSNVAVPEAVLGSRKYAAILVSFVPPLLSVHGWIVFLTYPVNPPRQAWLERHRIIPRLYGVALAAGVLMSLTFAAVYVTAPELLVRGPLYPASVAFQFTLAPSPPRTSSSWRRWRTRRRWPWPMRKRIAECSTTRESSSAA
jgi:hypothetical protein